MPSRICGAVLAGVIFFRGVFHTPGASAYLAAIAIEAGAELVTADCGFGRWPGLRRHPLDG